MAAVVWNTVPEIQRSYGTLAAAIERYLDGDMPVEQQVAIERVVDPALIAAIAQTRLLKRLVQGLGC